MQIKIYIISSTYNNKMMNNSQTMMDTAMESNLSSLISSSSKFSDVINKTLGIGDSLSRYQFSFPDNFEEMLPRQLAAPLVNDEQQVVSTTIVQMNLVVLTSVLLVGAAAIFAIGFYSKRKTTFFSKSDWWFRFIQEL